MLAIEVERLTRELAEARANNGYEKTIGIFGKDLQDAHDNGYNAAIEEAAKVATHRGAFVLADEIRALKVKT
jgi:hypothetical protein